MCSQFTLPRVQREAPAGWRSLWWLHRPQLHQFTMCKAGAEGEQFDRLISQVFTDPGYHLLRGGRRRRGESDTIWDPPANTCSALVLPTIVYLAIKKIKSRDILLNSRPITITTGLSSASLEVWIVNEEVSPFICSFSTVFMFYIF